VFDPVDELRERVELVQPVAAERTVVQRGDHEDAGPLLGCAQAAVVLPQPLVVVQSSGRRDRLVVPTVPHDELATGTPEPVQVEAHGVSFHAFLCQPVELADRELDVGHRGMRRTDRVSDVLQVVVGEQRSE